MAARPPALGALPLGYDLVPPGPPDSLGGPEGSPSLSPGLLAEGYGPMPGAQVPEGRDSSRGARQAALTTQPLDSQAQEAGVGRGESPPLAWCPDPRPPPPPGPGAEEGEGGSVRLPLPPTCPGPPDPHPSGRRHRHSPRLVGSSPRPRSRLLTRPGGTWSAWPDPGRRGGRGPGPG